MSLAWLVRKIAWFSVTRCSVLVDLGIPPHPKTTPSIQYAQVQIILLFSVLFLQINKTQVLDIKE